LARVLHNLYLFITDVQILIHKEALMSLSGLLNIIPGSPATSGMIALAIMVVVFYLARSPAHKAIYSLSRGIQAGFRLMADSVLHAEERLEKRNKEVLISDGAEAADRVIEREFRRLETMVERDMSAYPSLHRFMADLVTKIDGDYKESTEVPPPPPDWVKAVDSLANLESRGDHWLGNILAEVHRTAVAQHKGVMEEYRHAVATRHALLEKMRPHWRKLSQAVDQMGKTFTGLLERVRVVDNHIAEYEKITKETDETARRLSSSAMTQFFTSALVLLIAIGGAVINFNLIALPMSEMVGGGSYIGMYKTSDIAALVIILVELAMGLYLMESLHVTRLFPTIGQMDDKMRVRMIWVTFIILLVLACVESALAFMRDRIAADIQALRQTLAQVETPHTFSSWIPTVGQMVMGFILPFALAFVAIPLESFIQSSRTVLGQAMAVLLRGFAFLLGLMGDVSKYAGEFVVNLYDVFAFPLVWLEKWVRDRRQQMDTEQPEMIDEEVQS
jgi:ABC-type multidrug transport system fused ATPase/permease subunit